VLMADMYAVENANRNERRLSNVDIV
jgi:hypothetical protein